MTKIVVDMAAARRASPTMAYALAAFSSCSFALDRNRRRWCADGAIRNMEDSAVSTTETKYQRRSVSLILSKPCVNGSVSRNANSTCTPGSATRSSLSSSISSRSTRCFSVSVRSTTHVSPWPAGVNPSKGDGMAGIEDRTYHKTAPVPSTGRPSIYELRQPEVDLGDWLDEALPRLHGARVLDAGCG